MSDIQAYEQQIAKLESELVMAKHVVKLSANRDFQKAIIEGFCRGYVADLMEIAGDSRMSEKTRQESIQVAHAAGHLKRWLLDKEREAEILQNNIDVLKEEIEELRRGDFE